MSNRHAVRLVLLCEDQEHEDFVRGRLAQPNFRLMYVVKGPNQAGVLAKYPSEVRSLRAKKNQAQLGLVVMIDGDKVGSHGRRQALDEKLQHARTTDPKHRGPRQADDRIAILVPTRNVETWIVGLLDGTAALNEADDYKGHPRCNSPNAAKTAGARLRILDPRTREASNLFTSLPALSEANTEIDRLP